jgi:hypothetical protein
MQPTGGGNPPDNLGGTMELIELQANYNTALDALKATPEFAAKELAGQALQAEHQRLRGPISRSARAAAHAARLTNMTVVPVTVYSGSPQTVTVTEIPEQE